MHRTHSAALPALLLAVAAGAQTFTNYESPLVSPIRISADGSRLFTAHTADNRLLVWSLANPDRPVLLAEIPTGLEPVSVNPRTNDEAWVVNHLSDSISVVSVAAGRIVDTLRVKDEPSDVVFAGGKAFVTAAASDEVRVFDATTRVQLASIPVFGKDPRNLAVNAAGTRVYAVVQRSGNRTTIIAEGPAPAQPPPTNGALPAPPNAGLIVLATDPAWTAQIPYTLPDNDVVEIDVASNAVLRTFTGVGTTNTGIAVDPGTGNLWVANTEARNLVRFEPVLKGHAIDSRVTRITTGPAPQVTAFDLNPGINYALFPNPAALATALSEPYGLALDAAAGRLWVAAQGSDRLGLLDLFGNVLARVEVGTTPGSTVNTLQKRGPRGLALLASASRLYVLNKLSPTLGVVDTSAQTLLAELSLGSWDPTPAATRDGRKFLYDAKLSGNGTMSCASCHIDGDMDGIAWDLGDPGGNLDPAPAQPFPFSVGIVSFHPMKGPMTTQTLKGLTNTSPLHWRGDRANFQAFNGAFSSLMGGALLSTADMDTYAGFGTSIAYPPNPHQPLNRQYLTSPAGNNQQAGQTAFNAAVTTFPVIGNVGCFTCHSGTPGTNRMIITNQILMSPQQAKVPQLRNLYRKAGFARTAAPQKSGFGFTHDGAIDTLTSFVSLALFNNWPSATKDDIVTFLNAFDTGTAPTVGYQVTLSAATAALPATGTDLAILTARAAAGDCDLVAKGTIQGETRGLLYNPAAGNFTADAAGVGPFTLAALTALATSSQAHVTFTGVPPGAGPRIGRDRDLDGAPDGDDGIAFYGAGTAGGVGVPRIAANSEARQGNALFAITASDVPAGAPGLLAIGVAPASFPFSGITVLVDLVLGPPLVYFVIADGSGWAVQPLPIPVDPGLANAQVFAQFAFADAGGPQGLSATRGLNLTVH